MTTVFVQKPGTSGQDIIAAMSNLTNVSRQQLSSVVSAAKPLVNLYKPVYDAYMNMVQTALPYTRMAPRNDCCIPETDCPPYCMCQLNFETCRGGHGHATIRVTNTGEKAQLFDFVATTFQGSSDTGVQPTLSPASANLNPNQSVVINVDFTVDDKFQAGEQYSSDVKITGQYEQCVKLELKVQSDQTGHCDVKQGEIPTRIRAHHWYDHFQCEEPCFEPARPRDPATNLRPITHGDVPS
jgi:hypothetical protein